MNEFILRTRNLCKSYSSKLVVDNVNMEIKKGQVYGFIGKNGAGKTTFMKMICNLALPTKGDIELFGVSEPKALLNARKRIGTIIETPALFLNMTAFENMETQRRLIGAVGKNLIQNTLKFVGIDDTGKKKVKDFSLGMKQRLGLAIALLNNPDFLILDEPINGMDPSGIAQVRETIKRLVIERNTTILISSHILTELNLLATHYGIIENGKLIKQISSEELKKQCEQYIEIMVSDVSKAINTFDEKLKISNYKVLPNNVIQIFETIYTPLQINKSLINEKIGVQSITVKGQDLEQYFINLIGDKNE